MITHHENHEYPVLYSVPVTTPHHSSGAAVYIESQVNNLLARRPPQYLVSEFSIFPHESRFEKKNNRFHHVIHETLSWRSASVCSPFLLIVNTNALKKVFLLIDLDRITRVSNFLQQ